MTWWKVVHVDLVDASGTEQGYDNDNNITEEVQGIRIRQGMNSTLYPWHRILTVDYALEVR